MASFGAAKRAEGMIFVKEKNMIVEEAIGTRLFDDPPKREPCDITVSDFDGVMFKVLSPPEDPKQVAVHLGLGPIGDRLKADLHGAEAMEATFPGMCVAPEAGYHFAVAFDLDAVKEEEKAALLAKVSAMRRHAMGAPFTKALEGVKAGTGASLPPMVLPYRAKEATFIKPGNDRCTVVYAFNFPDETDNAIARVMLQQFAKDGAKVNGAPPCSYSEAKNPPLEVRDEPTIGQYSDGCGFISFVIFAAHIDKPAKFDKSVTMLATFRNYLHYHIKASKTYLHMRMRGKVKGWLQVLNRSHHEKTDKESKTASGKTFKRGGK